MDVRHGTVSSLIIPGDDTSIVVQRVWDLLFVIALAARRSAAECTARRSKAYIAVDLWR